VPRRYARLTIGSAFRKSSELARGTDLNANMLSYLVDPITGLLNVVVLRRRQITGVEGADRMLQVCWRHLGIFMPSLAGA
jgi:hypothetical protein